MAPRRLHPRKGYGLCGGRMMETALPMAGTRLQPSDWPRTNYCVVWNYGRIMRGPDQSRRDPRVQGPGRSTVYALKSENMHDTAPTMGIRMLRMLRSLRWWFVFLTRALIWHLLVRYLSLAAFQN